MVIRPFLLASQHLNSNEKITGYLGAHILLSVVEEKMLLSHISYRFSAFLYAVVQYHHP